MLLQQIVVLISALVVAGVIFKTLNEKWAKYYIIAIGLAIAFPIVILIKAVAVVLLIFRLLWLIIKTTVKGFSKAVVFAFVGVILIAVIGVTYVIPHIGGHSQRLRDYLREKVDISGLGDECRSTRAMMVNIVAEQSNRSYDIETEDGYRDQLVNVKKQGERKLAIGELALSLSLGGILLIFQMSNLQIIQIHLAGLPVIVVLELGIFLISISILYRVSLLDFLAYTGEEEFSSLEELDAALSYQEAVSQIGFLQLLTFLLVLGMKLTNVERETVRLVLILYSREENYINSMKFAWDHLRHKNRVEKDRRMR